MRNSLDKLPDILSNITSFIVLIALIIACSNSKKESTSDNQSFEEVKNEVFSKELIVSEDVWLIAEYQINDIPVTSKAKTVKKNPEKIAKPATHDEGIAEEITDELEEEYEIVTMKEIDASLNDQYYVAEPVAVTEVVIPLNETQTVVSYNKKGKAKASVQVISSPVNNEVEQIIFTDKKHKDIYNVHAGLSGKEVKRLRKELKHMVKKGKVFLYSDESNVMYLIDIQDFEGDEVLVADVESSEVQAIIWKDKKHHKKH